MNTRVLSLVLLCISMPGFSAAEIPAPAANGNTAADYSALVNGLPWEFRESLTVVNDEQVEGSVTRYDFVSTEAVKKTAQGNVYMKANLTVTVYSTPEQSMEAWGRIKAKADPDMGLSYAWDYLLIQDSSLFHLHAGCVVSEDNFDVMVKNFRQAVKQDKETPEVIRCRCGGGCN